MKRFLLKLGILALILLTVDFSLGKALEYVVGSIKVGGQGRDNYIANESEDDILVFGSSRAVHHYNTPMLEDSLGLPAYNCGDDGSGIILSYARLSMIKERHQPKIIIQDIIPDFDLFNGDNHKYLGWLKLHWDKECVKSIFDSVDNTEKYKMSSFLYRYNSRFLQNVVVFCTGMANDGGEKGFRPRRRQMDKMKINSKPLSSVCYDFDPLKVECLNRFVELTDGAKLFFVVSPVWYGMDSRQYAPVKELCEKKGIPLIDFSNNPKYVHNDDFFCDGNHLNARGADEFTKDLIAIIKPYM